MPEAVAAMPDLNIVYLRCPDDLSYSQYSVPCIPLNGSMLNFAV